MIGSFFTWLFMKQRENEIVSNINKQCKNLVARQDKIIDGKNIVINQLKIRIEKTIKSNDLLREKLKLE